MSRKINPTSFRLTVNKKWQSRWYSDQGYREKLTGDILLRKALDDYFTPRHAIAKVILERTAKNTTVTIFTARPGVVIGKGGANLEEVKQIIAGVIKGNVKINVEEVKNPELDAELIAQNVAQQLEKRIPFRRAMKGAVESATRLGAKGAKVMVAGRLNGADMARTEQYSLGSIPLHTLRANIDFAKSEADTTYGVIGIKVWVYRR
ncbi:30S ribosomal protein S3 [Candidatus Saccharibacteria bacterium]|nr:30S ribosomal protein S3 [Candidatus Saccharibacteria bacterium]